MNYGKISRMGIETPYGAAKWATYKGVKGMRTERVEFQTTGVFPLPRSLAHHYIDGRHLFVAPEVPSWIVVSDPEADALQRIQAGATIGEATLTLESHGIDKASSRERMKKLLQLLVGFFFFKSAEP